jgi:hypothetical protein
MIKDWNIPKIVEEIRKISWAATDPRMDGFVTWGCKQDLYQLKWLIEQELDKCSTYGGLEDEYVKKHEQKELLKTLGKQ